MRLLPFPGSSDCTNANLTRCGGAATAHVLGALLPKAAILALLKKEEKGEAVGAFNLL